MAEFKPTQTIELEEQHIVGAVDGHARLMAMQESVVEMGYTITSLSMTERTHYHYDEGDNEVETPYIRLEVEGKKG